MSEKLTFRIKEKEERKEQQEKTKKILGEQKKKTRQQSKNQKKKKPNKRKRKRKKRFERTVKERKTKEQSKNQKGKGRRKINNFFFTLNDLKKDLKIFVMNHIRSVQCKSLFDWLDYILKVKFLFQKKISQKEEK